MSAAANLSLLHIAANFRTLATGIRATLGDIVVGLPAFRFAGIAEIRAHAAG
jgi:hypothetical protein